MRGKGGEATACNTYPDVVSDKSWLGDGLGKKQRGTPHARRHHMGSGGGAAARAPTWVCPETRAPTWVCPETRAPGYVQRYEVFVDGHEDAAEHVHHAHVPHSRRRSAAAAAAGTVGSAAHGADEVLEEARPLPRVLKLHTCDDVRLNAGGEREREGGEGGSTCE